VRRGREKFPLGNLFVTEYIFLHKIKIKPFLKTFHFFSTFLEKVEQKSRPAFADVWKRERNRHSEPEDTGRNPVVISFYYFCWFLNHWDPSASSG
jgi:hypothetical protein